MQGVPLLTSDARVHAVGSVHKFRRGLSGALLPTRTLGLNDGGERFCVWSISALGMVGELACAAEWQTRTFAADRRGGRGQADRSYRRGRRIAQCGGVVEAGAVIASVVVRASGRRRRAGVRDCSRWFGWGLLTGSWWLAAALGLGLRVCPSLSGTRPLSWSRQCSATRSELKIGRVP